MIDLWDQMVMWAHRSSSYLVFSLYTIDTVRLTWLDLTSSKNGHWLVWDSDWLTWVPVSGSNPKKTSQHKDNVFPSSPDINLLLVIFLPLSAARLLLLLEFSVLWLRCPNASIDLLLETPSKSLRKKGRNKQNSLFAPSEARPPGRRNAPASVRGDERCA